MTSHTSPSGDRRAGGADVHRVRAGAVRRTHAGAADQVGPLIVFSDVVWLFLLIFLQNMLTNTSLQIPVGGARDRQHHGSVSPAAQRPPLEVTRNPS